MKQLTGRTETDIVAATTVGVTAVTVDMTAVMMMLMPHFSASILVLYWRFM